MMSDTSSRGFAINADLNRMFTNRNRLFVLSPL